MTTSVTTVSKRATELGLALFRPKPTWQWNALSVVRRAIPLRTVLRNRPIYRSSRTTRSPCYWNHSIHSSKKTLTNRREEQLSSPTSTIKKSFWLSGMARQTLKQRARIRNLPRQKANRSQSLRLLLQRNKIYPNLKMIDLSRPYIDLF